MNGIGLKGQGGKTEDTQPVKVAIEDNVPEVDLSAGASGTTIQSGGSYEGNWTVIYGADGPASTAPLQLKATVSGRETTVTIVPGQSAEIVFGTEKFGDITFDAATGKFTFKAAANQKGTLQLELIATDQDHDTVSSYFQIKVEAKDGPGVDSIIVEDGPSESNLGEGTNPDRDALTKPVDLPPGYEVDVTQDGWVIDSNGNYILDPEGPGHLTWNPVATEPTYTLDAPTPPPPHPAS